MCPKPVERRLCDLVHRPLSAFIVRLQRRHTALELAGRVLRLRRPGHRPLATVDDLEMAGAITGAMVKGRAPAMLSTPRSLALSIFGSTSATSAISTATYAPKPRPPMVKKPLKLLATATTNIARDTERVLQCQVLRCQERATRNFVIDRGESGLFETMVCEAHAAALKAGERYVYNSVENVIYMGQDAPPTSK
jgi:hypothetical protein